MSRGFLILFTMKTITTTGKNVQQVLVDDSTFEWANKFKWRINAYGYVKRNTMKNKINTTYYLAREIMNCPKGLQVDHINHDKLNNLKINLRILTKEQNQMNKVSHKNSTSKYLGVHLSVKNRTRTNKNGDIKHDKYTSWRACIGTPNKGWEHIGCYKTEKEAAIAYNKQALEKYGEYANLNVIPD